MLIRLTRFLVLLTLGFLVMPFEPARAVGAHDFSFVSIEGEQGADVAISELGDDNVDGFGAGLRLLVLQSFGWKVREMMESTT